MDVNRKNFERNYAEALEGVMYNGVECKNRTGINTIAIHHQYFHIKNITKDFPRIKGKMTYPKLALKELLWMLQGRVDIKWLNDHGVNYWNEWQDKEGTIGKSYGWQYRNFNGHDQVEDLIKNMLKDPMGRRHIINLWNSAQLDQMTLPPCMYDFHFDCFKENIVTDDDVEEYGYIVDLHAKVRSNDAFLGCPYDVMFCAWFLEIICHYLTLKSKIMYMPNDIHYTADNFHIYTNHKNQVNQYLANIEENKDDIIDSKCEDNFIEVLLEHVNNENSSVFETFDNYLNLIIKYLDEIKVGKNVNQKTGEVIEFKYPKIQADVAV